MKEQPTPPDRTLGLYATAYIASPSRPRGALRLEFGMRPRRPLPGGAENAGRGDSRSASGLASMWPRPAAVSLAPHRHAERAARVVHPLAARLPLPLAAERAEGTAGHRV